MLRDRARRHSTFVIDFYEGGQSYRNAQQMGGSFQFAGSCLIGYLQPIRERGSRIAVSAD